MTFTKPATGARRAWHSYHMEPSWAPRNDAELTAAWRLWLELTAPGWPEPNWDGTPAEAVQRLAELVTACREIEAEYLAASGSAQSADFLRLLQSMMLAASWTLELWRDDTHPLDAERAALLHADLSGFAEHASGVRRVLALGGGWAELDA